MNSAGRCDIGKHRENNEDSILLSNTVFQPFPNLFIVADGMGGHQGGEFASSFAIQCFKEYLSKSEDHTLLTPQTIQKILIEGIQYSNEKIYQASKETEELKGMGTTFLAATIINDELYVANIGDSRLYFVGEERIHQITRDHSLVEEMVRKGSISEEEAEHHPNRNVITRAVGTREQIEVDTYMIPIPSENMILMCSDGLTTMLNDQEILETVKKSKDIDVIVNDLVNQANEKGGFDNISVIIIQ